MTQPDPVPAIIQSDQPFKVEAVLSKTGGINALAKRPKKMTKGQEILPSHHDSVPSETSMNTDRVHLDTGVNNTEDSHGQIPQDQMTQHREQFVDPSRQLFTNHRVKIQLEQGDEAALRQVPPEDKSHLFAPSQLQLAEDSLIVDAPTVPSEQTTNHATQTTATLTGDGEIDSQDRDQRQQQFLRRIEQIKNSNESVGKDLEALEKLTSARSPSKQVD